MGQLSGLAIHFGLSVPTAVRPLAVSPRMERTAVTDVIDRESPVPYYEQLFGHLRDLIATGEFAHEERLPAEMELCREYGLSRATVRQTMAKLEAEGYAHRVMHRGVFATVPEQSTQWTLQEGFLESQLRHGRTGVETTVLDSGFVAPPAHVASALRIDPSDLVFTLRRVRSLEGRLAMSSTNWFPGEAGRAVAASSGAVSGAGSVNEALRSAGFVAAGARRLLTAVGAPHEIAGHLHVDPGTALLRVSSLSWDARDTPFDYYETWVITEVVPLEVKVSAH